jgi:hypothetical protein
MKSFIYILIISFSILSCSSDKTQAVDYEKIADKLTIQTATTLKEKKNLFLIGIGGRMMHDIQMMGITFTYYQEIDLSSARELIVYAVSKYLYDINSSQEIRPYLHEYPFTVKNVEIMILVYGPDRLELLEEKIYCIKAREGKLRYYTRLDHDNPIHEESFEEAVQNNRFST